MSEPTLEQMIEELERSSMYPVKFDEPTVTGWVVIHRPFEPDNVGAKRVGVGATEEEAVRNAYALLPKPTMIDTLTQGTEEPELTEEEYREARDVIAAEYGMDWDSLADSCSEPSRATDILIMDLASTEAYVQEIRRRLRDALAEIARHKEQHESKADIRVVRPVGRGILGQTESPLVPLAITDDRDTDYIDPALREIADLVISVDPKGVL